MGPIERFMKDFLDDLMNALMQHQEMMLMRQAVDAEAKQLQSRK